MTFLPVLVFFDVVHFTLIIQGVQGNFVLVCFSLYRGTTQVRHETLTFTNILRYKTWEN